MNSKISPIKAKLKEAISQEILEAAEKILANQGIAATSMAAIAQEVGVSVGTLYNYFKDKDELIANLLAWRKDRFMALLDESLKVKHQSFESHVAAVIQTVLSYYGAHRNFLIIIFESDGLKTSRKNEHNQFYAFMERLRPLTNAGVKSGDLDKVGKEYYPGVLAGLIRGALLQCLAHSENSFDEAAPIIVGIFLNGARRRV